MRLNLKTLCLCGVTIGYFLATGSPSCVAADADQEVAARALLGQAEKLIELALPQRALPVLDEVEAKYPDTEAAVYAGLRRAQSKMFLHEYEEAIAIATQVAAAHPGEMVACWAQCVVGQSLLFQGKTAAAVRELWKVAGMLPSEADLGPLNEAREVLGRAADEYLAGRPDDLDAVAYLGLDPTNIRDKARTLAILAAYRARTGRYDKADAALRMLSTKCAAETAELDWARSEVALYCIKALDASEPGCSEAVAALESLRSTLPAGHHSGARVHLALARHYKTAGDGARALQVLQNAEALFADTANAAEILYELGKALSAQGLWDEAIAKFTKVADEFPRSGFAAPALYGIGTCCIGTYRASGISALTRLAEGGYDRNWRANAYAKLGALYRSRDRGKARECYTKALQILQACVDEQDPNIGVSQTEALQGQVEMLTAELQCLSD